MLLLEIMRPSVLLVDDSDDVVDVLSTLLEARGYEVVACGDGRQALEAATRMRRPPALIVLDMHMPDMDGRQFLEARRFVSVLATVPVVAFTSEPLPPDGLPAGVTEWLPKHTSLDTILQTVARAHDRAHSGRAWLLGLAAGVAAVALAIGPTLLAHLGERPISPGRQEARLIQFHGPATH